MHMKDDKIQLKNNMDEAAQRHLYMDMPCGVLWYTVELDPQIIFANRKSLELLGYSSQIEFEAAGKSSLLDFIHQDDIEYIKEKHRNFGLNDGESKIALKVVSRTGGIFHIVGNAKHAKYTDGRMLVQLVYIDVTELKQAQSELEEREKIIRSAVEQSEMFIWTYNIKERKVSGDYLGEDLFGYDLNSLTVPDSFYGNGLIYKDDEPLVKAMFAELFAGKTTAKSIARWLNKNTGNYFWCKIVYTTVFDKQGNPIKAMGTATDVGEERYLAARYNEEMGLLEMTNKNTLYNIRINLFTGEIEELRGLCSNNKSLAKAHNFQTFFAEILR